MSMVRTLVNRRRLTIHLDPEPVFSHWRIHSDQLGCIYLRLGKLLITWHRCGGVR